MKRISGMTPDEVLGRRAFEVFPFLAETGEDRHFYAALEGEASMAQDRPFAVAEAGRQVFIEGHYSPLRDEAGDIQGGLAVIRDVTERKKSEAALRFSHQLLDVANRHTELPPLLEECVAVIKDYTGCEAVGIRLLDHAGNIPYQAYQGFPREFYELESPLSAIEHDCMCINVIKGETDRQLPFFTAGGSFFINDSTRFLAGATEEQKGATRNACNRFGYESIALIPLRAKDQVLGLIHAADPRENMAPLDTVELLKQAGLQFGAARRRPVGNGADVRARGWCRRFRR